MTSPKREDIIKEIIQTERKYIQSLLDMQKYYVNPLRSSSSVSEHVLTQFESNFDELMFVAEELLQQLEFQTKLEVGKENIGFPFFALQHPFLKAYKKYYLHYDYILELLRGETKTNVDFYRILDSLFQKNPSNLTFASYLIMPIQRIPRYATLLKELQKHTSETAEEYEMIKSAIVVVESVTENINESLRDNVKQEQLVSVKKEKKFVTISVNDVDEMFSLEVPSMSSMIKLKGQMTSDWLVKRYFESLSTTTRVDSQGDLMKVEQGKCEVNIEITSVDKRDDGVYYMVKVIAKTHEENRNWTLAKRYTQFYELNERYKDEVRATTLKPVIFPPKRPELLVNHSDENFIQKRRIDLEGYVNSIRGQKMWKCLIHFLDIQNSFVKMYFTGK